MRAFALVVALTGAWLSGCAGPTFRDAEVRAYPDRPTESHLAADRQVREDPDALRVDTAKAVAFFRHLESAPLAADSQATVPDGVNNRALILAPEDDADEYWIVAFQEGGRSGEPQILWCKARVRWTNVDEPASGNSRTTVARSFTVSSWTAERARMWREMITDARD